MSSNETKDKRRSTEVIRVSEFVKAAFDSFMFDERISGGHTRFTQNDAMLQLMKGAAPEHLERIRELRPDLFEDDDQARAILGGGQE